jgi:hypothetical protein
MMAIKSSSAEQNSRPGTSWADKKCSYVQTLRELFDAAEDDAKKQVMSQAYKLCSDLDACYETLFVEVEHGVLKPLEEKIKKNKK